MARIKDWIPVRQDAFADWAQHFVKAAGENAAALHLSDAPVESLKAAQAAFMEAWAERQKEGKSPAHSAAKKTLVDGHRASLRGWFNTNVRYNPSLSDTIRVRLGVPVPDRTKSRILVGDHQVAFDLYPKGPFLVGMRCHDAATGEQRIFYGMGGIMVRFAVGDKPLAALAELTDAVFITRVRHRFVLESTQRGKWLSVSCAWVSAKGELGSPSPIRSTVVP
jgi:hypothetical protein